MKIKIIAYVMGFVFFLLLLFLFKLQVIDHAYYRGRSERNRVRPVILEAPRGIITDARGRTIVGNRLSFDCYVLPQDGELHEEGFQKLSQILDIPSSELSKIYKEKKRSRHSAVLIARDIGKENAIAIEEASEQLAGVFVKTKPLRQYFLKEAAAHVIGYVGAIGPKEFKRYRDYGYRRQDRVGRDGVERIYDSYLRGQHGASQFEVDSRGRLLRVLSIQEQEIGKSLQLTIDSKIQKAAHELLENSRGAVTVMELKTGGILAMASRPSYDPNVFIHSARSGKAIHEIMTHPHKALMNRSVAGEYPPGSTFKVISALAGLGSGKVHAKTRFFCPGSYSLNGYRFRCWRKSGHGSQNVIEALQHSCNVYFYQMGYKAGVNLLEKESRRFGLGEKTGLDLPQERKGLVPGATWKRRVMREKWYGGETLNYVIGQGFLLTTPVQMLRTTAIIATGGKFFQPYVVSSIDGVNMTPQKPKHVKLNRHHLKLIQEGMIRTVQSSTGTGQKANVDGLAVSGKTGTAQASGGDSHGWFIGYAPSKKPQVAISVLLEHGGQGGGKPTEIAGEIFKLLKEEGWVT